MEEHGKPPARIIFLNGASSSGKSTLGRILQKQLDDPFLYFSSDQLVGARLLPEMDSGDPEGKWNWKNIRPRFFDGFHGCIAALSEAGNDLIVEHVLESGSWYADCAKLLAPYDPFLVGVHCPLAELERREKLRGDRKIGEGRSHLEDGVHRWCEYDFEIDTSLLDPDRNAQLVKEAFLNRKKSGAVKGSRGLP